MPDFSTFTRKEIIKELKIRQFDVLIIGGGITGAGILVDAQSRGLSCCLIEKQDFSEGTSSRSTRLIHGGLRYLKQWKFKLVSDTGKERTVVQHIARHLTYPKKVLVPSIKNGNFSKVQLSLALWVYEKLAQVPKPFRHKRLSKEDIKTEIPSIATQYLLGGIEYVEFQTNDSRLTIENIKKGVELGGKAINQAKVIRLSNTSSGKVNGVFVKDDFTNEEFLINATCVVNATGAWSDQFSKSSVRMSPSKGVHLVFNKNRFPLDKAVYFDTPDKRMIFAIPDEGCTYLGTTDTFEKENIDQLTVQNEDYTYLLEAVNSMFPFLALKQTDIISTWVGVRPLISEKGKKPSEVSRKHEIFEDKNGLLTITGGKLTGYRKMAQKITDKIIQTHYNTKKLKSCHTKTLTLTGATFKNAIDFDTQQNTFINKAIDQGWQKEEAIWVYKLFGSQSTQILTNKTEVESHLPNYLLLSLLFCIEQEMICSPSDFIIRRTNLCYFHSEIAKKNWKEIARIIYQQLAYSEEEKIRFDHKLKSDFALAYASIT
jgi:glycerol-3-phosphate dehydrogenase